MYLSDVFVDIIVVLYCVIVCLNVLRCGVLYPLNVLGPCGLSERSNTKLGECQAPPTKLRDPRGLDIKLGASYNN